MLIFDVIFYHDSLSAPTYFFSELFKVFKNQEKFVKKSIFDYPDPQNWKKRVLTFLTQKNFFFAKKNFFIFVWILNIIQSAVQNFKSLYYFAYELQDFKVFENPLKKSNSVSPSGCYFFCSRDSSNLTSKSNSAGSI